MTTENGLSQGDPFPWSLEDQKRILDDMNRREAGQKRRDSSSARRLFGQA